MTKKTRGLCVTCIHSIKCVLKPVNKTVHGVQFCEECETIQHVAAVSFSKSTSKRLIQQPPAGILGLCSNCDNYPECKYPRPEAGVWHCEAYQ